jgi:hypothetical protein
VPLELADVHAAPSTLRQQVGNFMCYEMEACAVMQFSSGWRWRGRGRSS